MTHRLSSLVSLLDLQQLGSSVILGRSHWDGDATGNRQEKSAADDGSRRENQFASRLRDVSAFKRKRREKRETVRSRRRTCLHATEQERERDSHSER